MTYLLGAISQGVHYLSKPRITCVHAPYKNSPIYILFLLKSSNIITNLSALDTFPYVHKGPKKIQKLYITCVQMFRNAKIRPHYMYNIKSWIFGYKVDT